MIIQTVRSPRCPRSTTEKAPRLPHLVWMNGGGNARVSGLGRLISSVFRRVTLLSLSYSRISFL